ncbi:MAG TPA: hypothetical protein VGI98_03430 [Candidatus Limnocylindrales bacterium]|jgi:hypothetical protein
MEARIVTFPGSSESRVRLDGERLLVDHLVLVDGQATAWLAAQPMDDHALLVERALKIGLTALQSVGVTLNVDAVRAEFDRFADQSRSANDAAAKALEQVLRTNFADGDGRLPRTLEAFLGDRGKLRTMVDELFDPKRRDSAMGQLRGMLEQYFDGDGSRLATLLDPTRLGSPLYQFRQEMEHGFTALQERLVALEAAQKARGEERARSAAKGADFEDLLEAMLGDIARGSNDLLERTGTEAGNDGRSKKGDFVLTIDSAVSPGCELRLVIEAKDREVSGRVMRDELRAAKANRDACVALVVFSPAHAPTGIAPFDVRGGDVYAVIDPAAPDAATLEAAVKLARLLAVATLRERQAEVDVAAVGQALDHIRATLDTIRGLKTQLTSISNTSTGVSTALDKLREAILGWIATAERELTSG